MKKEVKKIKIRYKAYFENLLSDVDECVAKPGQLPVCGSGFQCQNTVGSFSCVLPEECPEGYVESSLDSSCLGEVFSRHGLKGGRQTEFLSSFQLRCRAERHRRRLSSVANADVV